MRPSLPRTAHDRLGRDSDVVENDLPKRFAPRRPKTATPDTGCVNGNQDKHQISSAVPRASEADNSFGSTRIANKKLGTIHTETGADPNDLSADLFRPQTSGRLGDRRCQDRAAVGDARQPVAGPGWRFGPQA